MIQYEPIFWGKLSNNLLEIKLRVSVGRHGRIGLVGDWGPFSSHPLAYRDSRT